MPDAILPQLLVTDFAGTTFRDDGAVLEAYRAALNSQQLPFTEAELLERRGASKLAVMTEFASRAHGDEDVPTIANDALAAFEQALTDAYQSGPVSEVPGAATTMRWLQERGCSVALTTGFPRSLVDLLLDRLGWKELFNLTLSGDDVAASRPAPFMIYRAMADLGVQDVRRVAVIGDTPLDLQAGMNAQAGWVIGVLSGAHTLDTLGPSEHTHIVASIAELPRMFTTA